MMILVVTTSQLKHNSILPYDNDNGNDSGIGNLAIMPDRPDNSLAW